MRKETSPGKQNEPQPPPFGERLKFVIWLSAFRLGLDSAKDLAEVLGKRPDQLSRWVKEDPRPSYDTIKLIAEKVEISAPWLDDPKSPDAREPELWKEWWSRRRPAKKAARKRA